MKFSGASIVLILITSVIFTSCKNDIELNAPYKEIPSIYAVLNPQERLHMIRINKVFLGEGDANQMAKVADSVNYPAGELTVTLNRFWFDKQLDATPGKKTITFRDSVIQTNSGAFSTEQRVYVSYDTLDHHDGVYGDYVLTVKNNKTGNVFTAKNKIIDSVNIGIQIQPLAFPYYPYDPNTDTKLYIDYSNLNPKFPNEVKYIPNQAKMYQLVIRMHFYDVNYDDSKIYRYVDYVGGTQYPKDARSIGGSNFLVVSFKGQDIFNAAGTGLAKLNLNNEIKGRIMYKIEYLIYSSTQEYIDYLQYSAPSFNISQQKPIYSNFENKAAIGIFTFRTRCSVKKAMSNSFISKFSCDPNTCQYFFYTSDFNHYGCGYSCQ